MAVIKEKTRKQKSSNVGKDGENQRPGAGKVTWSSRYGNRSEDGKRKTIRQNYNRAGAEAALVLPSLLFYQSRYTPKTRSVLRSKTKSSSEVVNQETTQESHQAKQ